MELKKGGEGDWESALAEKEARKRRRGNFEEVTARLVRTVEVRKGVCASQLSMPPPDSIMLASSFKVPRNARSFWVS